MGRFVADHFEATHQKVGTFRVVNGTKIGGNVASYFCLSDGTVIHAVAGPLNAQQYLRELRWAVDLRKLAAAEAGGDVVKYRAAVRKAHVERLAAECGPRAAPGELPPIASGAPPVPTPDALRVSGRRVPNRQGQVHSLLAHYPVPKLSQLYTIVFEGVLNEKVSALPVNTK